MKSWVVSWFFFILVFLSQSSTEAHGHCEGGVCTQLTLEQMSSHYALLYGNILEAITHAEDSGAFARVMEIGDTAHQRNILSTGILEVALEKYKTDVASGALKPWPALKERQRNWLQTKMLGFLMNGADAAEKAARYGILFGIGWLAWETAEFFFFLPHAPGGGLLCNVFPFVWGVTVAPIMDPLSMAMIKTENVPLYKRLWSGIRLKFQKKNILKEMDFLETEVGILVRQNQKVNSREELPLQPSLESSLWVETLLKIRAEHEAHHESPTAQQIVKRITEALEQHQPPNLTDVVQFHDLLQFPLQILNRVAEFQYIGDRVGFWELSKIKIRLGQAGKAITRFTNVLAMLSRMETIENGPKHAFAVKAILQAYEDVLVAMDPVKKTVEPLIAVAGVPIGFGGTEKVHSAIAELKKRVKSFRSKKSMCWAAVLKI